MSSWVNEEYIKRLECAAEAAVGGHPNVDSQTRQEAEDVLLSFRRSNPSFDDCRILIENSSNGNVKFQAITGLREAVIRLWNYTEEQIRNALQDFTMSYAVDHLELPPYLTDAITRTLAVMIKLDAVNQKDAKRRDSLYQFLKNLVLQGNSRQQLIACSVISNLMTEFSINSESSNMGITMENHWTCKKNFEKYDLKIIFDLTLQVMKLILSMQDAERTIETINLLLKFLKIFEHLFMWTFAAVSAFSRRTIYVMSDRDKIGFEPPKDWESVVINHDNLCLIFSLNERCRKTEELSVLSMSCLAQLSSLGGQIIATDENKCAFLSIFVTQFLRHYKHENIFRYEALNVANICCNLTDNFKIEIWEKTAEMKNLFHQFITGFTMVTCVALAGAIEEERLDDEDQIYPEAFEIMLNGWTTLVMSKLAGSKVLLPSANTIFEHYVKSHILQPEGWRPLIRDDDIDELVEDDKERYSSQLMSIAALARLQLNTSLEAIIPLMENRILALERALLQDCSSPVEMLMENLFEDIHWLILIATFIMCDDCDGETVTIPLQIMKLSISQKSSIDEKLTLRMLGSPHSYDQLVTTPGTPVVDLSIRVVAVMLRLCHISLEAANGNMLHRLSPEILSDLIYFLAHWAKTYIFFDESYYDEISPIFSAAYGRDSSGARWCVDYVISFVCSVLQLWSAEASLLTSAADLLMVLVKKDTRCSYVAKSEKFWTLGHGICAGHNIFHNHPPQIKQIIVTAVVIVGTSNMNMYRDKYWEKTMDLIKKRYQTAKVEIFNKKSKDSFLTSEFLLILDLFCGAAEGSRPENCSVIFNFLSEVLSDGGKIIEACHGLNENIVISILSLFSLVAHGQISFLEESKCRYLYEWTLSALKSYTVVSKNLSYRKPGEEIYQDLTVIFELLTNFLDRDFIDFSDEKTLTVKDNVEKIEVCDVVLYGLTCVFPNVDKNFLSYPSMCLQYYKLVTFLCEIYPGKVELLPQNVFIGFMKLLQEGLMSHGNDVCKLCLEGVQSLHEQASKTPNPDGILQPSLGPFARLVFDVILVHAGDMELLTTASETFYAILRQNPGNVAQLFEVLVQNQVDTTQKQRLMTQFNKLPANQMEPNTRDSKRTFIKIMEEVVFDIRGILWVR